MGDPAPNPRGVTAKASIVQDFVITYLLRFYPDCTIQGDPGPRAYHSMRERACLFDTIDHPLVNEAWLCGFARDMCDKMRRYSKRVFVCTVKVAISADPCLVTLYAWYE